MQRIYQFFIQRKKTAVFLGILLLGGGVLLFRAFSTSTSQTRYVLEVAEQGMLTTSVSGTGQVQGEAEIEVKPEVSGKVTKLVGESGQHVEEGDVIAVLDAKDAQKSVRDARISLESAQIAYDKLTADPDALSLLQAENALAQAQRTLSDLENSPTSSDLSDAQNEVDNAERSLEQAERNLTKVQTSAGQDLESASEDGYNAVTEAFADITSLMTDLSDLIGTEQSEEEYISYYNLMISSSYSDDVLSDYQTAQDSYNDAWSAFQNSNRDSGTEEKSTVITLTLQAAKDISTTLNSAQILLNRVDDHGYQNSTIADHIDEMMTTIPADVTRANSIISSLQSTANTIAETDLSAPNSISDAEDSVQEAKNALATAQENYSDVLDGADADEIAKAKETVAEREQQLADLNVDTNSLDVRSQELSLESARNKYNDALEDLAKYTVRAPISGTLASVNLHVGEAASSASALAVVVAEQFTAQMTLNEVDVAKVALGDRATLAFDAIEGLTMTGKIIQIDTIGTVSQGVVSYNVLIGLDTVDERVLSGMSANISIITDVRQDVVIVSSSAVKSSGSASYVEVLDGVTETGGLQGVTSNTAPRHVTVEVGLSNDTQSEIVSGLNAGEYVVTRTITDSTTSASSTSSLLGGGGSRSGGFGGSFPQ